MSDIIFQFPTLLCYLCIVFLGAMWCCNSWLESSLSLCINLQAVMWCCDSWLESSLSLCINLQAVLEWESCDAVTIGLRVPCPYALIFRQSWIGSHVMLWLLAWEFQLSLYVFVYFHDHASLFLPAIVIATLCTVEILIWISFLRLEFICITKY